MQERTGVRLNKVDIAILDAEFIGSSSPRSNSTGATAPAPANARLAATHRLFSHAALWHPEYAELIARVLATPFKHGKQTVVSYRNDAEVDALLAAPDRATRSGRATTSCSWSAPGSRFSGGHRKSTLADESAPHLRAVRASA
jgi:hypothetical protein